MPSQQDDVDAQALQDGHDAQAAQDGHDAQAPQKAHPRALPSGSSSMPKSLSVSVRSIVVVI